MEPEYDDGSREAADRLALEVTGDGSEMDKETRETITRIIKSCVYGDLATISADGKSPSVRPVCAFLQDDLTILVPTHIKTRKIAEIEAHPEVEICFVDKEHWQVRARGAAEVVEDLDVKKRLMETTLDPNARTLLQVKVTHAEEAGKVFATLMGDVVEPRREFIQSNALKVVNLDV